MQEKYTLIADNEARYEHYMMDDAELVVTAYGTSSRICRSAVNNLRAAGLKVGMIRPLTLWPFPSAAYSDLPKGVKGILDVEMSAGFQMVDDIRLSTLCDLPIATTGRWGGHSPTVRQVEEKCKELLKK
jgi:2-oxoglutarate ferredoxin oxidoreductase subunit alpha